MSYFIRQMRVAINFLLIASIGYTYGDYEEFRGCEESQNCLSCQPACCGTGFISGSLLYWRAFQDGLNTCIPTDVSNTVLPDGRIISTFKGKGKDPDFKWKPGFRIAAGYEFACSNWDVGASWTHFHSKANGSRDCQNRLRWNIDLDVIDLLVAYQCDYNSCFNVRPYIGLRGARIDQKLRLGGFPNSTTFATTGNSLFGTDNQQKFRGIGPLVGIEADVKIACGFSLYVNGAVSWLYGRNNARLTNSTATIDVVDFCRIKNRINSTLLAADASFGVRWQTCFCKNKQFYVQLGYEHHRYFDYNQIGKCGDLSFDGVQLGLGIGF